MPTFSSTDSFLQKPTEELQYLVQNPSFYDPSLVAEAGRELRRRGALVPRPETPALAPPPYQEVPAAGFALPSWWPALVVGLVIIGLSWWGLGRKPAPEVAAKKEPTGPIVLEAVRTRQLPSFEQETAVQVARTRRLLPAADRADTTAAGRYARMARRYWLAENAAQYLTAQARGDSASGVFAEQIDLTLERISWFMKARAYNQSLTPVMEERLTEMQQGLQRRRNSLQVLRSAYANGAELPEAKAAYAEADEAADIGRVLRGLPSRKAPIAGNLASLGSPETRPATPAGYTIVRTLPQTRRNLNPLYVLDGELLPSDPDTGEAPAPVHALPPDSIAQITVIKKKQALAAFGPRAHSGAVVVVTKAAARAARQGER
ncbi:hypothetical protein KLP40_14095 [Hymenobacter sp. NST-14]|uniref:hypothetical protein n=1 Tax=Hymenobacter piscis TaxID=2839984 RepID=UPI001C00ADEA|nr:hypothetical protein [Hymenobacter piscis]MBT9394299.1 hypothetical protein [Hymenobacter piscis]